METIGPTPEEVLQNINTSPYLKVVFESINEVSCGKKAKRACNLMKLSLTCSRLLDLYSETKDSIYMQELEKQREALYGLIPGKFRQRLQEIEIKGRAFFDEESLLKQRLRNGDNFEENDILGYLRGKAGDSIFFGELINLTTPEWNLNNNLFLYTVLFDIRKDLDDYESDVKEGSPNILFLSLIIDTNKTNIPNNKKGAIEVAKQVGSTGRILKIVSEIKALSNQGLQKSPALQKSINENLEEIQNILS